jgi:hypothetical protein
MRNFSTAAISNKVMGWVADEAEVTDWDWGGGKVLVRKGIDEI